MVGGRIHVRVVGMQSCAVHVCAIVRDERRFLNLDLKRRIHSAELNDKRLDWVS